NRGRPHQPVARNRQKAELGIDAGTLDRERAPLLEALLDIGVQPRNVATRLLLEVVLRELELGAAPTRDDVHAGRRLDPRRLVELGQIEHDLLLALDLLKTPPLDEAIESSSPSRTSTCRTSLSSARACAETARSSASPIPRRRC